ncbi:MAG: hypothetical protein K2H50_03825 [Paramuribaculum sp.]|nr:hypothetical protein [Paramuribaculum sp.]
MNNKDYSNEIDLRRYIRELKLHKWLLCAIFLMIFGLVVAYIARKESEYTAHAALLIEDTSDSQGARGAGSMMQMMRIFSTGGFASSSVDNEILLVNTIDVATRTVKALNLNVNCIEKDGIFNHTLFEDAPISLTLSEECGDTLSRPFNVKVTLKNGKADIKVYRGRFFKKTYFEKKDVTLPYNVSTPLGDFTLAATGNNTETGTFVFGVTGISTAAWNLYEEVGVKILDKLADGIEFTYTTQNKNKAVAVLNTMMNEYNMKRLDRKRETSLTELNFITDRINSLYTDLKESEAKVEKFKTESNFVDIESEAPIILETSLNAHEELLKASAQILYYEQVLELLNNHSDGMLPAISTPGEDNSSDKSGMIGDYNEQMAILLELRRSAKPGNKALIAAETRINQMRSTIVNSFTQLLKAAKMAVAQRRGIVGSMDSHLRKLPAIEKEYINLSRDQLLKNELYAFLVEKRENALMKLNSQDTLGFVIDKAYVEPKPSIKKAVIILIAGLLFALAVPMLLAFGLMKRKDLINNSCDLTFLSLESHTVELKDNGSVAQVRSAIMSLLEQGTVYIANLSDIKTFGGQIFDSFTSAGIKAAEIKPDTSDMILGKDFKDELAAASRNNSHVFVPVSDAAGVANLAPAINSENTLCVIALNAGSTTRSYFAGLVSGLKPENILVVIINN